MHDNSAMPHFNRKTGACSAYGFQPYGPNLPFFLLRALTTPETNGIGNEPDDLRSKKMQNIAKFEVRGNVVKINAGNGVAYITVVVESNRKNDDGEWETSKKFIDMTAFKKSADWVVNRTPGDLVQIEGTIEPNEYEKDGQKVYSTDLVIRSQAVLTPMKKKEED
ncbi:single-stranded DNA-binding protein [Alterisphingorhabdus coralli]|uniref:Single-stranded DNA-binding protein n=1 Tax=Alterisphingorhabdus coralli TaxID=3071408 RepID=A0AA97FAR3_9SPHN|nr:single-stranded DNA-binding protein [Parasphingorhabdus sp. SCSIO 66989]WOE76716.1 single-stranded DNA-binding protein [Parasphingorhabdus sp. SCSIO 66989]